MEGKAVLSFCGSHTSQQNRKLLLHHTIFERLKLIYSLIDDSIYNNLAFRQHDKQINKL